jgi:type II secretory ATPase GspE/PulE/Tfp pilus assembly ATPase PilB-like protein
MRRLSRVVDLERDGRHIYLCGPGCSQCSGGIKGRTVVAEVVATDPKLLECLRSGGIEKAQEHWIKAQEGRTTIQHIIEKIVLGLVDPSMAEAVVGPLTTDMVFRDGVLEKSEYAAHL